MIYFAFMIFSSLAEILKSEAHIGLRYAALRRIYRALLDDSTALAGTQIVGPFAQTDYLLKKHNADFQLRCRINDARRRLQNSAEMDEALLLAHLAYDVKAVAFFAALVLETAVPEDLRKLLPLEKELIRRKERKQEYVRFIVSHTDGDFIYGKADGEDEEVRIFFAAEDDFYHYDWSYLRPVLKEGTQLNIVRLRRLKAGWAAGLIIYEPDFLVDISSIAAGFEAYGATPLTALLGKVQPQESNEAILLGHLAGQMLDEEVHNTMGDTPYRHSVKTFFRTMPLNILGAGRMSPDFHTEAQQQQARLRKVVRHDLPAVVKNYRPGGIVLEPSFFSEMLGLQGRMDFLQTDMQLLIEQKSGKAGWPEPPRGEAPYPAEKHYVQMLLYMELLRHNFSHRFEANKQQLYAFLLYSHYEKPLVGLGFAPELFFKALRLRNEMVAQEFTLAHEGFGLLRTLKSEDFNVKNTAGKLWKDYQQPKIEHLLRIARNATEKEWNHVNRLLTFTAREHLHAKLGTHTKENAGFASKWHATLEEKRASGDIYDALALVYPKEDHKGAVERVSFRFAAHGANETANFRKGDIVAFYPYEKGCVPDIRQSIVMRATIEEITPSQLTLLLRAVQSNALVFLNNAEKLWAVEHDFFESSFAGLYRGIFSFLYAPKERRNLLLLERAPRTKKAELIGDYSQFSDLALRVKQAEDFFLIVGPPGTGKTSYGMLNTLKEALTDDKATVLVLAYTNRAVDEICSKLKEEGLPFLRVGSALSCDPAYHEYLLEERLKDCTSVDALRQLLLKERVIVGTTTALSSKPALLGLKPYDLAIIDEASQLLEPHLLGLLSAQCQGEAAIRKFVMIGDHKQLPAVVLSDTMPDCHRSLFERLLQAYGKDPRFACMLTRQGRMHEDIAEFVSTAFYENALRVVPLPHQTGELQSTDILGSHRVLFFAVSTPKSALSGKVNMAEAEVIAALAKKIYDEEGSNFSAAQTLGIIVPYRNQIAAIRSEIARFGIPALADISIDTVERYQGSQRDHIIYGFTVQDARQLRFLTSNCFVENGHIIDRKLNVAMTRARHRLYLVGNTALIGQNPLFARLIEYVKSRGGYRET